MKRKRLISMFLAGILLLSVPAGHVVRADGSTVTSVNEELVTTPMDGTEAVETSEDSIVVTETVEDFALETVTGDDEDLESDSKYATKRLIVVTEAAEFDTYGAETVVSYGSMYVLSYATEKQCKKAYKKLEKNKDLTVEIDAVMETESVDNTDNNDVSAEEKQKFTKADTELKTYLDSLKTTEDVEVAVIDTGIDTSREEFKNRITDTGIDLLSSGDNNSVNDDNGHGTAMAAIICENSSENVKIMPVKVANSDGKATILSVYQGIQYAMENGADVINLSMNTLKSTKSEILTDVIDEATEQGIIIVVSAGNDGTDTKHITPADVESAIVVGAVENDQTFSKYSNYGATVDYVAYGAYGEENGTSYAAANVSGIVAELLSKGKDADVLDEYVTDLGKEGHDKYFGNGFIGLYTYVSDSTENPDSSDDKDVENNDTDEPEMSMESIYEDTHDARYNISLIKDTWHTLSGEEFEKYLMNSEPWEIGKFLKEQDEGAHEEILKRFSLEQEAEVIIIGDTSENNSKKCALWQYYESEYDIYTKYLQVSADIHTRYNGTSGWFNIQIVKDGVTASARVSITLNSTNTLPAYNDKNDLAGKIVLTQKSSNWNTAGHGFTITSACMKQSDADKAEENAGQGRHCEILLLEGYYNRPQYFYTKATNSNKDNKNYGRLNPLKYDTSAAEYNGATTLLNSHSKCNDANSTERDDFEIQALIRQFGIKYSDGGTHPVDNGTLTFTMYRDSFPVTVTAGTGISSVSGGGTFKYGVNTTISATPATGYHWGSWTGSSTLTNVSNSLQVKSALSYTATGIINTSKLTINPNGGTWTDPTDGKTYTSATAPTFTLDYNTTKNIPDPTREGYTVTFDADGGDCDTDTLDSVYTFGGWDGCNYSSGMVGDTATYAGTYIGSEPKRFLTGPINGGKGILTAKWNQGAVTLPTPTRTGHTFLGWYNENEVLIGGGENGASTTSYLPTKSEKLTARWRIHESTLTVDPNGGTWTFEGETYPTSTKIVAEVKYPYGKNITIPDADKTNYTVRFDTNGGNEITAQTTNWKFTGWSDSNGNILTGVKSIGTAGTYISSSSTTKFTFGTTDAGTGAITARWTGSYDITLEAPKKTDYIFKGWYTAGGECVKSAEEMEADKAAGRPSVYTATANTTLYAQWTFKYYVSYDGSGATEGSMENSTHRYDESSPLSENKYKKIYTINFDYNYEGSPAPKVTTKEVSFIRWDGYNMDGSLTGKSFADKAYVLGLCNSPWQVYSVKVYWGGTSYETLSLSNRTGFIFKGWNEDADAEEHSVGAGETVNISAGYGTNQPTQITYYAVWEREKYDITYHANNGTDEKKVDVKGKTYGLDYYLKENTGFSDFEKEGRMFVGWSRNPNADINNPDDSDDPNTGNKIYAPGDKFTLEGPNEFYAIWSENINVLYDNQGEDNSGESIVKRPEVPAGLDYTLEAMMFNVDRDENGRYVRPLPPENGEQVLNSDGELVMQTFQGWSGDDEAKVYYMKQNPLAVVDVEDDGINAVDTMTGRIYSEGDILSQEDLQREFLSTEIDGLSYHQIYAIWDAAPDIEAHDVYISLHNAKNLTNAEFLVKCGAVVTDREDPAEQFENPDNFYVLGGDVSYVLSQFNSDGELSVFLVAVDSAGNERRKKVTIHVVDTTAEIVNEGKYTRFISPKYADPNCRPEDGGLEENSIWRTNPEYAQVLADAMAKMAAIEQETKTITFMGQDYEVPYPSEIVRSNAVMVWQFTKEDRDKIKAYVREHGPGNAKEPDALKNFLVEFSYCRLK